MPAVVAGVFLALLGNVRGQDFINTWPNEAEVRRRARSPNTLMKKIMMPDDGLAGRGAVCMDGTDFGFFFAPASDPKNAKDWQIYLQGGGWCYDEMDCWGRSFTVIGSSKDWINVSSMGGLMSDDCTVNPDFCNYNRVHVPYCDGNSFASNRDEPLVVKGQDGKDKPLYFRGKRVLEATFEALGRLGLRDAENVLLTGCSAGGLAAFLHADRIHDLVKGMGAPLQKFRVAPMSGFFLLHDTVENVPVYTEEIKSIFNISNAVGGLNQRCVASMSEEDAWKCNFAQHSYAHTEAPIFVLNSGMDSWQTKCIYASKFTPGFPQQQSTDNGECGAVREYGQCLYDMERCTSKQMATMNVFISDFEEILTTTGTFHKPGNGAFVHSCSTHCEAQDDGQWLGFRTDGVSMQQAVSKWWNSKGEEPATQHSYSPCLYHTWAPHACNPTCGGGEEVEILM